MRACPLLLVVSLAACGHGDDPEGLALLGGYAHTSDAVTMTDVVTADDDLDEPRDIAFHPDIPGQAWIVNRADHSVVIVDDLPGSPSASWRQGPEGQHFLSQPSALAFGAEGTLATIAEEDRMTQGNMTPADFMGPTLWTSDPDVFDAGVDSHMDMLHDSPDGMGIAWDHDNVYWVFDGYHDAIARYDFGQDHGLGGTDHSDGEVARYVEGEVNRATDESSNLAFDPESGLLYIADTGNHRIAVLDTATGERGSAIQPNYDDDVQYSMDGASLDTLIVRGAVVDPTGLELHDGLLWVSDYATGKILAFTRDGTLVDWLETGIVGGLQGMAFDADGQLYVVDSDGQRVIRIAAIPAAD
jgi:sugar lactone lactonase YvrE